MPFLLPAISAAICDVIIVYLYMLDDGDITGMGAEMGGTQSSRKIYETWYILPLALFRLFLLIIPLPYRSYTGTAVKCPILYQLLYGGTLLVLFFHMVALAMLDPSSLSTLIVIPSRDSSAGLYDLTKRHIWLLLALSSVSNLCHFLLFLHVRSTAPAHAEILRQERPKVLFYYVKEREDTERDSLLWQNNRHNHQQSSNVPPLPYPSPISREGGSQTSSDSIQRMQQMTNEFVIEIQSRLQKTKVEWTKRLDDYRMRSATTSATSSSQDLLQRPLTPFRVLLQLFAYVDVLTNGRLDAVYNKDDGAELIFFIPQLLSFLLHGAYDSSPKLEEWILDTCRINIHFAHRCYWFLRAWCLENTHETADDTRQSVSRSNSVNSFGSIASGENNLNTSNSNMTSRNSFTFGIDVHTPASTASTPKFNNKEFQNSSSKFLPEERAVLEGLMVRVMECGEGPARTLQFGSGHAANVDEEIYSFQDNDLNLSAMSSSPSALMMATESGAIPIDPQTGMPSARHWDSVAAPRKYGFLPLDRALTNTQQISPRACNANGNYLQHNNALSPAESWFDATPRFMDALLNMAEALFRVPREQRNDHFHRQLQLLEVQALPSNSIYVPLQDVNHRVWRIVADESIAINTKERVPCIVCLEVVEYTNEEIPRSRDVRSLLERAARASDEPLQSSSGQLSTERKEKDLLNRWRYGYRDPHRRDTALEKIAYSMRDGIRKIPLDQMKTSMKAQIEKLKDTKTNLKEFWTLHVPETFDDDSDSSTSPSLQQKQGSEIHTLESLPSTDIERGEEARANLDSTNNGTHSSMSPQRLQQQNIRVQNDGLPIPALPSPACPPTPPAKSPMKNTPMGQWSSPKNMSNIGTHCIGVSNLDESLMLPANPSRGDGKFHFRSDSDTSETNDNALDSIHANKQNGSENHQTKAKPLSHHNGIPKTPKDCNRAAKKNPSSSKPRSKPPVVFKEDWKEKEERLRSASAYGNHPGWRLLPVLVKANDDLRQEQLASQLIYRIALILARERVPVWLCPYDILAITARGGIIEAIPDTISIASLKKNDPNFTGLKDFFHTFFKEVDDLADAKANFCESLAAYSIVCFLLQIKDRHNGNILLDNRGHLIHIDFGFFFLSSPGKNTGFESAPFKLTRDFVELLDGPDSRMFRTFRALCYRTFIALRRHCMEVILLVEMLKQGNEDLACFRGRPDDAIRGLRERFRLDLNDRACMEYVNALVDESLENWRTNWYDRYQRYCVGVL